MQNALLSPAMPKKIDGPKKAAFSLTLTPANVEALQEVEGGHKYAPSVSQMVDNAIAEYVRIKREEAAKTARKPK